MIYSLHSKCTHLRGSLKQFRVAEKMLELIFLCLFHSFYAIFVSVHIRINQSTNMLDIVFKSFS